MARNFYGVEKGLDIYGENNGLLARVLSGTAAPDGLGDQAAAPIGSIYLRSGTGELYQKIANAGNSSDWQLNFPTSGLPSIVATGITTVTTVDSVPHASVKAAKWFVEVFEEATPANRRAFEVYALTDGTVVDDNLSSILKVGSNFNLSVTVDISGANMRLRVASTTAGVTVSARRLIV